MKPTRLFNRGNVFCGSGWFLALLLACICLPRLATRLFLKLPSVQNENWTAVLASRQRELSACWNDPRPLIVIAGDSHVEGGSWYDLLGGRFAVRNCGLARAKISDVAELIPTVCDRNPDQVILMCGINDLGGKNTIAACLADYQRLLQETHSSLHPRKLIVLSVMPVRQSAVDQASRQLNRHVAEFNRELEKLCARQEAEFVDVTAAVVEKDGGLNAGFTSDGLHLNRDGYQHVARVLAGVLSGTEGSPRQ